MNFTSFSLSVSFLLVVNSFAAGDAPRYIFTDLGAQSRLESMGNGINAAGEVAGASVYDDEGSGSSVPAIFSLKSVTELSSFTDGTYDTAKAINAAGQIVGTQNQHAFLYSNGLTTDLTPTAQRATATAINDSGQIVGALDWHAFLYSDGTVTDLASVVGGYYSEADAINASGQIVGSYYAIAGGSRAFLYSSGVVSDLGTLGGTECYAYGINARGQIVGSSSTTGDVTYHAFVYQNGKMTDLGGLKKAESGAEAINASGEIVGYSYLDSRRIHAVLWLKGKVIDLNSVLAKPTPWELTSANAINDFGQIVGQAVQHGLSHAFLLTPVPRIQVSGGTSRVTGNRRYILRGTANAIVRKITYRADAGKVKTAIGTARWHLIANLHPGKNIISISAHGPVGQPAVEKITVIRR